MVKFAEVAPLATVTVAGTVAAASLSLERVTVRCATVPTARAFNVTVPLELTAPPGTLAGFSVTEETRRGVTLSVAVVDPFNAAVITGLAAAATTCDVTVKLAVVAPAATTTLPGTVADAVSLLDNVTVRCAAVPAAAAFNVTVAVEFADPPNTLAGFSVNDATPACGVTVSAALCVPPFSVAEMLAMAVAATL